ncbi:hypothetical protein F4604DRAFT_1064129 [Suillus subluteus]|nr:hypothetical protein F4604DRAFT_1064129 [Suillus subluteus]
MRPVFNLPSKAHLDHIPGLSNYFAYPLLFIGFLNSGIRRIYPLYYIISTFTLPLSASIARLLASPHNIHSGQLPRFSSTLE